LIPYDSKAETIVEKINEIFTNPNEYKKVINSINKYKLRTTSEMVNDYNDIYKKVTYKNIEHNSDRIKLLMKNNNNYICNVSYSNYAWILDTLKWKLISKIKIPRSIKRVIRKVRNKK